VKKQPKNHFAGTILAAVIGAVVGTSANVIGWWNVLAVCAVLALALAAVRALRRANETHKRINREELD